MKKNIMMRLSALLLVAVLLTTCVISGTFAKYVTSKETDDEVRVAQWGITLSVEGAQEVLDDDKSTDDVAVKVLNDELAAPGTYKELAKVSLSGTPEVAYKITVDVNLDLGDKWLVNADVQCPVVFKVGTEKFTINDTYTTTALLEAAVEKAVRKAIVGGDGTANTKEGDAGAALTAVTDLEISWTWAFERGADEAAKLANNKIDTALAATGANIAFYLTITVEQVD